MYPPIWWKCCVYIVFYATALVYTNRFLLACSCKLLHCGVPRCSDCYSSCWTWSPCVGRPQQKYHLTCMLLAAIHIRQVAGLQLSVLCICYWESLGPLALGCNRKVTALFRWPLRQVSLYMIFNPDISFIVLLLFSDMDQPNSSSMLVLREEQHHKIESLHKNTATYVGMVVE